MITQKAKLSAKYLYIRCDGEFELHFTNGSVMPFWKGFYCLLSEDLQKYNTNNELDIVTANDYSIWWMSSDTLVMSVTDINTDMIGTLSQISNNNANANLSQVQILNQQTQLLMSLQNTLSTFLNTYVQLHNVVDYGFQTAMIDNNNSCDLFIAKPSSGYTFNCSISFNRVLGSSDYEYKALHNYSGSTIVRKGGMYCPKNSSLQPFFNFSNNDIGSSSVLSFKMESVFPSNDVDITFRLFDNENTLLSGYQISNVSATSKFDYNVVGVHQHTTYGSGWPMQTTTVNTYKNYNYSYSNFITSCVFDNGVFKCGGSSVAVSNNLDVNENDTTSDTFARSATLGMTINFDVSYIPS